MLSYWVSYYLSRKERADRSDDLIVEIDVILPRASTLHFAHDIGETIQCMLERYAASVQTL